MSYLQDSAATELDLVPETSLDPASTIIGTALHTNAQQFFLIGGGPSLDQAGLGGLCRDDQSTLLVILLRPIHKAISQRWSIDPSENLLASLVCQWNHWTLCEKHVLTGWL